MLSRICTGTVRWFSRKSGYGLIRPDAAEPAVTFHSRNARGPAIEEGQRVQFKIKPSAIGPEALEITPVAAER